MRSQFKSNRSGSARVLTPDQLSEVIGLLRPPHDLIVQICYFTAARITEVTLLRAEDIDLEGRSLVYRAANTKTGESRTAAIPQQLYEAMKAAGLPKKGYLFPAKRASGKPRTVRRVDKQTGEVKVLTLPPRETISPQAVDKELRRVMEALDITGASLHSFRRSMATHLQDEGLTLADIATITGHRDLASLTHYLDANNERAMSALERVSSRIG